MNYLDRLENESIYIIREAFWRFKKISLLWSMGKDSTCLLWLCRKAFFGQIPFPVLHIDTSYKFKEIYDFRNRLTKNWKLDLIVAKNDNALAEGMNHRRGVFECCHALKTQGLKSAIEKYGFEALFVGIRRDEHVIRAKERFFSLREKDLKWAPQTPTLEIWNVFEAPSGKENHFRIHPLLSWREIDIWQY